MRDHAREEFPDNRLLNRCMSSHTHKEFIKFLDSVERAVPAGKIIHAIADIPGVIENPNLMA